MRVFRKAQTIKSRLTLWNVGILFLLVSVFTALTHLMFLHRLTHDLQKKESSQTEFIEELLASAPPGYRWVPRKDSPKMYEVERQQWVEVLNDQGKIIFRDFTGNNPFATLTPIPLIWDRVRHSSTVFPLQNNMEELSLVQQIHRLNGKLIEIRIATKKDYIHEGLESLFTAQLLVLPIVLLTTAFAGYFLAGKMLQPVTQLIAQARTISADNLHERLPVHNPDDELGHLATTFNAMLNKLDSSFQRIRQFTGDASHEIRTPLTIMRSVGENALSEQASSLEKEEAIGSILEEVEHLTKLVDDLLMITRADNQQITIKKKPVVISELLEERIALLKVLAEEKDQKIISSMDYSKTIEADANTLRLAITNILVNAIKYTPAGGEIHIRTFQEKTDCCIEITDSGPGIAEEHISRIFDRFYRVDKARSRADGGNGLGLAIARWAVEINRGKIEAQSKPGAGSTFRICLTEETED